NRSKTTRMLLSSPRDPWTSLGMTTGRTCEIGVKKRQEDNDGLRFIQPVFGGARKGRRVAAHLDAGRDRFGDCGMGRSRNEISPWRQSATFRTTADRREGLQIPRRDQYDGFGETNGAGTTARQYRRHRAGDSAYSQGQTSDRSARRMESP